MNHTGRTAERSRGLRDGDVLVSRRQYGENRMKELPRKSILQLFFSNLNDPVIKILLCALGVNFIATLRGGDLIETVGIAVSVLLATLISTLSEHGSESAFRRLTAQCERSLCRVWRDGVLREIPIEEIVVGDLVRVEAGEQVPADGWVVGGWLRVDQSAMTGESREIEKRPRGKRGRLPSAEDAVFRGCMILGGEADVEIFAVGDETYLGKISHEIQSETRESPLKRRLRTLARQISRVGYVAAVLVGISYLFQRFYLGSGGNLELLRMKLSDMSYLGSTLLQAFMLGLTVIVVAVPDGYAPCDGFSISFFILYHIPIALSTSFPISGACGKRRIDPSSEASMRRTSLDQKAFFRSGERAS